MIGASGGIGAAVSRLLAERGAQVHALSRSGASDPRLDASTIDLEDEESVARAAARLSEHGPLDLVFVASGLLHSDGVSPEKNFRQLSAAGLERYFAVNAIGPALVAKHFVPLLCKDERAVFAALSARVGSIGDNRLGGWYGYRASKAALNMIVKTLSIELARTHPRAVCVALHPGTVETELSAPFRSRVPPQKLFSATTSAQHLLKVIDGLDVSSSGGIYAWDGSPITP